MLNLCRMENRALSRITFAGGWSIGELAGTVEAIYLNFGQEWVFCGVEPLKHYIQSRIKWCLAGLPQSQQITILHVQILWIQIFDLDQNGAPVELRCWFWLLLVSLLQMPVFVVLS